MNIIIAVNEKYVEHAKTMLFSLASNNSEELVVYLLQSSVLPETIERFDKFMRKKCHGRLEVAAIPDDIFDGVPVNERISKETYYRLLAFELLPPELDRALWLDADMIIKGDITALYHSDFHGKLAVACAEKDVGHNERLGIAGEHRYFNAGMILFNLDEMRRRLSRSDIFACIHEHQDHLDLMDQDILNLLLANEVEYADGSLYNNGAFGFNVLPKEKMRELRDTARIIHYWGAVKPWNWKGANWADGYWWSYEWKRMDRFPACIAYRLKNAPIKLWHLLREAFFLASAIFKRLKKHDNA